MSARCPHCNGEVVLAKPASAAKATALLEPPRPLSTKALCACGHGHEHHASGSGKCRYGSTAHGLCGCEGWHSRARKAPASGSANGSTALTPCARAVLVALLQRRPRTTTRAQAALIAGYSQTSGGFAGALAQLRGQDLIIGPADMLESTEAGARIAGHVPQLPTGDARIRYWCERVSPCAAAILESLTLAYPAQVDRAELAERTGYSPTSGGFAGALAELRTLGLVDGFNASVELMEDT